MRRRRAWWHPSIDDIPEDQLIHLKAKDELVGKTWLGREFAGLLEEVADKKKFLRAKKCLENGAGCRLRVRPSEFSVGICCSGYVIRQVTFWFKLFTVTQTDRIIGTVSADAALIGSVLSGEVSEYFVRGLEAKKIPVFPGNFNEITAYCNCSDLNFPCIHIIAAGLILAEALDDDPWHLFTLRGITHQEILARIKASRDYKILLSDHESNKKEKRGISATIEIPDSYNPVNFYSFGKNDEEIPKIPDDTLVIDPMILLGKAPCSLGSKNMSDRIKSLYPGISAYAKGLLDKAERKNS
jgi:uncharacterized Zn finger protein